MKHKTDKIMKHIFKNFSFLGLLFILVFIFLIVVMVDYFGSRPEYFKATVIDKHYQAEIDLHGTGFGISPRGEGTIVSTHEHSDEKFILVVKSESGEIITVECRSNTYYSKKNGDPINCAVYKGLISNAPHFYLGVN